MEKREKKETALKLHELGKSKKEIARLVELDIKTVRRIIAGGSGSVKASRKDSITVDEALLKEVYHKCEGYIERTHEVLNEEHGVHIGYSTLTRKVREMGLGEKSSSRSSRVDDVPGEEMQHDTSPYTLKIGGKKVKVILSGVYLRYSKMRYIRFYRRFNRFTMKCFMDEALRFWGYCADACIIDNTNLAILYGSGPRAVFVPEMVKFANNYGFKWQAHEIGHSNRKAGKERNFWTVETNFFPGRSFSCLEDLNEQAFLWATRRYAKRPQSKTGLIPIQTFETEKSYLYKLPDYVEYPTRPHHRILDAYGFAAFAANFYWVPVYAKEKDKEEKIREVHIIEYARHIDLYYKNIRLHRYDLPKNGVRNERFKPSGVSLKYQPTNRKKSSTEEEKALRDFGETISEYVDFVQSKENSIHYKHQFLRQLYHLLKKMAAPLLQQTMERALKHKVDSIQAISNIAAMYIRQQPNGTTPDIPVPDDYMERDAYIKGRFCDEPGFDKLGSLLEQDDDDSDDDNNI